MHRFELRVRYGDTDQMGWAYYGNYLRWFEIGRAEMLRSLGRSYRDVEEQDGILLPVVEARCLYRRGARYDELVVLETGVLSRGRASVRFGYRVAPAGAPPEARSGAAFAVGLTEHCFLGRDGRPKRPSPGLAAMLDRAPAVDPALAAELA